MKNKKLKVGVRVKIAAGTNLRYRANGIEAVGVYTASCKRTKSSIQLSVGYDHDAGEFKKKWFRNDQIVELDPSFQGLQGLREYHDTDSQESEDRKRLRIARRYIHHFQKPPSVLAEPTILKGEREIEVRLTAQKLKSWQKLSERRVRQSPMPPSEAKPTLRVKVQPRRTAPKRHQAMTLARLVKEGAVKISL